MYTIILVHNTILLFTVIILLHNDDPDKVKTSPLSETWQKITITVEFLPKKWPESGDYLMQKKKRIIINT